MSGPGASGDAVVIGGGIGGLVSAALLAAQDRRVMLFEASDRLGGFQHRFTRAGFHIEPHFHFLQDAGAGRPVRQLLERLGIDIEMLPLDPVAELHFPDHRLTIGNDRKAFIAQLSAAFPQESSGIASMFYVMRAVYEAATRRQFSPMLAQYAGDTVEVFVDRFLVDRRLKAIVSAWSMYFGYPPSQIAALAIVVFSEACWDGGNHHPRGGIATLVDALRRRIERGGGVIRTNAPVARIRVREARVCGVVLQDGSRIDCDTVIAAIDARSALCDLPDDRSLAAVADSRLAPLRRFRSPFCVYLGVRGEGLDLRGGAAVRLLFAGDDLEAQDRAQRALDTAQAPLSIGIPTRMNPGLAPDGHDLVILYSFIDNERIGLLLGDAAAARAYAQGLLQQADRHLPGLAERVVMLETSATLSAGLYTARTAGAIGWEPAPTMLSQMPGPETEIGGLFLAGQWTCSGGGMNNVMASAQSAVTAAQQWRPARA